MITLRLFGHETDANHIREEGRHCHLDRRGRLYDWRNDLRPLTMRRLLEPWIPKDDERLKARSELRAHRSSGSPPRYGAAKELSALAPGNSGCPLSDPARRSAKGGPHAQQ
jgi:hypothetical protein